MIRRLYLVLISRLSARLRGRAARRDPDFIVGGPDNPYLLRWWLIPRNRVLNVYLHQFLRDDDDRALHDHPWAWCSLLLSGRYYEHTIAAGGIHRRTERHAGSLRISGPRRAHRIELPEGGAGAKQPCWTLFITGPRVRLWGFHCPQQGWLDYRRFTRPGATGETGAGCDG